MTLALAAAAADRAAVLEYLPLVQRVARRMARRLPACVSMDDLVAAGSAGLIDAVARFDATRSATLATWAELRIRGAMLDFLRASDWLPRTLRARVKRGECTAEVVSIDGGRERGQEELSSPLPCARTVLEGRERQAAVAQAIESLPLRLQQVLALYYVEDLTLKEAGQVLGVTESRACQLHAEALRHLRADLRVAAQQAAA